MSSSSPSPDITYRGQVWWCFWDSALFQFVTFLVHNLEIRPFFVLQTFHGPNRNVKKSLWMLELVLKLRTFQDPVFHPLSRATRREEYWHVVLWLWRSCGPVVRSMGSWGVFCSYWAEVPGKHQPINVTFPPPHCERLGNCRNAEWESRSFLGGTCRVRSSSVFASEVLKTDLNVLDWGFSTLNSVLITNTPRLWICIEVFSILFRFYS